MARCIDEKATVLESRPIFYFGFASQVLRRKELIRMKKIDKFKAELKEESKSLFLGASDN